MILTDAVSKARELVTKAVTRTIKVYDPSKNKFIVSGVTLDGVIKATLSSQKMGESSTGTDQSYFAFYDVWDNYTFELTVLPTARSNDVLQMLALSQSLYKGFCRISILENGSSLGTFTGYIVSTPAIDLEKEASERTFSFVVKQPQISVNTIPQVSVDSGFDSDITDIPENVVNTVT